MNPQQKESAKKFLSEHFGSICWGCIDESTVLPKHLEVDHIVPEADGGPDTIDNLALLCSDCNIKKGRDLTIGGLRKKKGLKDDQHPVNLKLAMEITRRKAREEHLMANQPPLPLLDSHEKRNVVPSSEEPPRFSGKSEIQELLRIRDRDDLAQLLVSVTKMTYSECFEDWGQPYNEVQIFIQMNSLKEYNTLLGLSEAGKDDIACAVGDIFWGSGKPNIRVTFSLNRPPTIEESAKRVQTEVDINDLPF